MNLTNTQQVDLTIAPTDRKGRPAPVENVEWATSNSEVATVTASADGLKATVVAVGPLGDATISVTADGHMGEGTTSLAGTLDITVTAADATVMAVTAGTPIEQP